MLIKIKSKVFGKTELYERMECYTDSEDKSIEVRKWFYNTKYKYQFPTDEIFKNNKIELLGMEIWYKNGKEHRENDLPSEIGYYVDGSLKRRAWYKNGKICRDNDKPSVEFYFARGDLVNVIQELQWHIDGKLGRENDEPAVIDYYENGKIKTKQWFMNDEWHRENDLPARIDYYKNGSVKAEYWCRNDNLYRENNKPTYIAYDYKSGKIKEERYDTGIKPFQVG